MQHFDTSLSTELNADLDEMQIQVDANTTGIRSLERLRTSDLERSTPHWVVDALNDVVQDLPHRVEDLEGDDG